MKILTKLITTVVITLSLLLGGATGIQSNDKNVVMDYIIIKEFVASERSDKFLWTEHYNPNTGVTTRSLADEENKSSHTNFKWKYSHHFVHWSYNSPDFDNSFVEFIEKDYQEFISPDSRGFVVMKVVDFDKDGRADFAQRSWTPVMQDEVVMIPSYPKGLINLDWYTPTQEEADEFLQKEMKYWAKMAGKEA